MTVEEFNTHIDAIESIANNHLIPLIAHVLKAIVTLICLSIKGIARICDYIYKITGGESVNAVKEFASNVRDVQIAYAHGETHKEVIIPATIHDAMGFKFSTHHPLNNYIWTQLKPELTTNLIYTSSYKAPRNHRCKKNYICINNRCVPKEIAALIGC